MTSPQQKPEANETSKTKSILNPNANAFFSKKDMPQAAWKPNDHVLNGEVSEHDAGGGLSSGDAPTSSNPVSSDITLDTGPQSISASSKPSSQLTGAGPDHSGSQLQCEPSPSNGSVKESSMELASEGVALVEETEPGCSVGMVPAASDKSVSPSLEPVELDKGKGTASLSLIGKSQGVDEATTAPPLESKPAPIMENGIDVGVSAEQAVGGASLERAVSSTKPEGAVGGATDTKFDPVLREKLQKQLEYYFSRENLEQDSYLQTQMDGKGWVIIAMVANFKKVMELTKHMDVPLVTDILKSLKIVEVDERGEKVRANTDRSYLVLRELPEGITEKDILKMFEGDDIPSPVSCESMNINNHFCLKFESNNECRQAHILITNGTIRLHGRRVLGFIKSQNTRPMNQYNHGGGGGAPQQHHHHQHQHHQQQQQHQQQPAPQQPQPQPPQPNGPLYARQVQQPQPQIFASAMGPLMSSHLQQTLPHHGYYLPHLSQWAQAAPNPQFFDQTHMFSLANHNMKPGVTNHQPRMYHPIRHSHGHRGGKQHRPHSAHTDIRHQTHGNLPPARFNIRHNHPSTFEPRHPAPVVPAPVRPEVPAAFEPVTTQAAVPSVTTAPQPLLAQDLGAQVTAAPSLPASGAKPDTSFLSSQSSGNRRSYNDSRRANQFHRKMRRNDDNSKNVRSQSGAVGREGREQFNLEKTSFPPLPGSATNATSGDAGDGSRLADVVKGASTPTPRSPALTEDKPKTSSASSTVTTPSTTTVTVSVVKTSATASANVSTVSSAGPKEKVGTNSSHAKPAVESACEKVPASSEPSRPSKASNAPAPSKPASQVLPPPPPPATTTASVKPAASAVAKPTSANDGAQAKPPPASTASSVVPSAPPPAAAAPKQGGAPTRISYAQMVVRKQAETAAKATTEGGASAQAPPSGAVATPSPLSEQTQTPTSTSGSTATASAPKAVSGGARPKEYSHNGGARPKEYSPSGGARHKEYSPSGVARPKEYSHRNYEPREQRSQQGSRRTRDYRQPRYESRRNDRDSKN